jgi:hypothetical protein
MLHQTSRQRQIAVGDCLLRLRPHTGTHIATSAIGDRQEPPGIGVLVLIAGRTLQLYQRVADKRRILGFDLHLCELDLQQGDIGRQLNSFLVGLDHVLDAASLEEHLALELVEICIFGFIGNQPVD